MSIIFFPDALQTSLEMIQIDNVFPVVFEERPQGVFVPVAPEALPEAHGFDAVDSFGETIDPQFLFNLFEPPVKILFPAFVHEIAALEIPVQIQFDRLPYNRKVEPPAVVGQYLRDPFEGIPEVGPIHLIPHKLNDSFGRSEDPDDRNFLAE